MKNLLNFFFSFDKLFKEKLVVPFFWLALIVIGLAFLEEAFRAIKLPPLGAVAGFINFWALLLLSILLIRILAELVVAIFRINDNLSPDGGKSELADIDPVAEARKAAELAAARTREATRTVGEKASEATKTMREKSAGMSETVQGKAKAASASVREKAEDLKSKASKINEPKAAADPKPAPTPKPTAKKTSTASKTAADLTKKRGRPKGSTNKIKTTTTAKAEPAKKRGRPAGSKNKTTSTKSVKSKTPSKRGPKPGTKIPRDKDGNLLKKDGTPRKKPGPKK